MLLALLTSLTAQAGECPAVSVGRGWQDAPFELAVEPCDSDATILYSTDTSAPSIAWPGALAVDGTALVRLQEIAADGSAGEIVTHTYLFMDDVLAGADMDAAVVEDATLGPVVAGTLTELPILSIVTPTALSTTETEVSFEFIEPGGEVVQSNCGARKVGGHSLTYAKNIFRLSFRSDYGDPRLDADLFGDDVTGFPAETSHDALTLRSGSHDSVFYLGTRGQYLRNLWMDETQLELGHLAPHGRFAHLYVNGAYFGLYHVRERFDASFLAAYLGGDEDDYEAVNGGRAVDGSGSAWSQVVANAGDYEAVQAWLNVENFLDYMVLNFYAGNDWDWNPNQNWMSAGPTTADAGGFVFHSSDSDICLYYDYTINILHEVGPSYVFQYLREEGHPDFQALLADRIYAMLAHPDGVLTADAARARYARLATLAEDAVVAEAARWGGGWWTRDGDWITERDHLLDDWFPYRTEAQLAQFRAAGWYPLDAPEVSLPGGEVGAGAEVTVSLPAATTAELWVTADGSDPREPGGDLSATATGPDDGAVVPIAHTTVLSARVRDGEAWGPLRRETYETDETPSIVLNEWNAVEEGAYLDDDGEDRALGRVAGNGGDWIELVVLEDGLDLRGWRLAMRDRTGDRGELTFTDATVLAELRAGTILTVAEDLPEDTAYDPERGDWRLHLRAADDATGETITAADFDVTARDWQLTIWDADGHIRFGPAGEGVSPRQGIGGDEVGLLAGNPLDSVRRTSDRYADGTISTYGAPNEWDGGRQDLGFLRDPDGEDPAWADSGTWAPDTGGGGAEGGSEGAGLADSGSTETGGGKPDGCGCATGGGSSGWMLALLGAAFGAARRRRLGMLAVLAGCGGDHDKLAYSEETATNADSAGADSAVGDDTGAAAATCYADTDRDGFGDPAAPGRCAGARVADATDCDDGDSAIHPDAPEVCDGVDNDCDGLLDDDDGDLTDGLPFYTDDDGDGYGTDTLVGACATREDLALQGGDCDDDDPDINPGAVELCDDIDQDCDGAADDSLGASADCPGTTCAEILATSPGAADGAYYLTLASGEVGPVACDMTTDGGGWTLGFVRNTASTGSQGDFGAGEESVGDLGTSPAEASASSVALLGWLDLNSLDYDELAVASYYSGTETWRSESIPRGDLRIDFGEDGYLLYGGDSPYYWCGGDATYTDSGIGATDNPAGAPSDCKGHGSLGSGWDFSDSPYANAGLTLCGGDGSYFLAATWGGTWLSYGAAGGAQAIWAR